MNWKPATKSSGKWGGAAGGPGGKNCGLWGELPAFEYVGRPPTEIGSPDPGGPARTAVSCAFRTPFLLAITGGSRSGPADSGGTKILVEDCADPDPDPDPGPDAACATTPPTATRPSASTMASGTESAARVYPAASSAFPHRCASASSRTTPCAPPAGRADRQQNAPTKPGLRRTPTDCHRSRPPESVYSRLRAHRMLRPIRLPPTYTFRPIRVQRSLPTVRRLTGRAQGHRPRCVDSFPPDRFGCMRKIPNCIGSA